MPRLTLSDLPEPLRSTLEPRVERLGYLGEFFCCAGHVPDALLHFIRFTEAAKGSLDDPLVELIALTMATMTGNDYERNQHERLAVRLGQPRSWVRAVEELDPEGLTDPRERTVQWYLLRAVPDVGRSAGPELQQMTELLGPSATMAVLLLAGRYLAHALVVNSLGVGPPVPSIFEDGFDGD